VSQVEAGPPRFAAKTAAFRTGRVFGFLQSRALPDIRCERFGPLARRAAWSAAIAQLVEHVIRNDGVGGSSPSCGTSFLQS
jgi:hypothetical protein